MRDCAPDRDRSVKQVEKLWLVQPARLEQLEVIDQHPLFFDRCGEWRHRARRRAAHIGVMTARGHEKARREPLAGTGPTGLQAEVEEHGRDHGDIRQMGTAAIGIVQHVGLARRELRIRRDDACGSIRSSSRDARACAARWR